jgi:hypothetical protein
VCADAIAMHHRHRTEHGPPTDVDHFPLNMTDIAALQLEADPATRWRQLDTAQVYALDSALQAFAAVGEATGRTVLLETGEETSWWESGAFARATSLAERLVRITEHQITALEYATLFRTKNYVLPTSRGTSPPALGMRPDTECL